MWDVPALSKLSSVREPVKAFVFMEEADSRNYNLGTWVINVTTHEWVDPVAIFHNGQTGISFADGHTEAHRWVEDTTIRVAAAAQNNLDTPFYWAKKTPLDRDWKWVEPRYKYADWPKYLPAGSW
jgi:prepilin-type processing-associated H-X9-DG protein